MPGRSIALATAVVIAFAGVGHTQVLVPTIAAAAGPDPDPSQLYALETTCTQTGALPDVRNVAGWKNLLPQDKKALSFYVSVQSTPVAAVPALSDQIKSSVLIAFSFAFDQTKQTVIDNRAGGSCNQSVLVFGQSALYVVPSVAYTDQFTTGAIGAAFNDLTKIITAVAPVFGAAATGGAIKSIGDVSSATAPASDLISQFNPANTAVSVQSSQLHVGTTVVTTPYGQINVTLRPVTSVLQDRHTGYRTALRAAALAASTGAGNTIDTSSDENLNRTCELVASRLAGQGFTSSLDEDYGIIHAAAPVISSTSQMAVCLGAARANEAILFPGTSMFEGVAPADIPPGSLIQPSFRDVQGSLSLLTQQWGRYAKLTPPQTALEAHMGQTVDGHVAFQDPLVLFVPDAPTGMPAAVAYLRDQGYHHVGFFAQVTSAMSASQEYHVVVGLVAVKADATATSGCYANSLALYPHFNSSQKIDEIWVSNDVDEVKALVGTRGTGGDNGFTLSDCPAAPAPAAGATPAPSPRAGGGR